MLAGFVKLDCKHAGKAKHDQAYGAGSLRVEGVGKDVGLAEDVGFAAYGSGFEDFPPRPDFFDGADEDAGEEGHGLAVVALEQVVE